jgi:hypothetical protein
MMLAIAMANRNNADTRVPTTPPKLLKAFVDRCNVVGVERVPEAKTVGQRGGAEKDRVGVKGGERPEPGGGIENEQENVDPDHFASNILLLVVEEIGDSDVHSDRLPAVHVQTTEASPPRQWFGRRSITSFQTRKSVGGRHG